MEDVIGEMLELLAGFSGPEQVALARKLYYRVLEQQTGAPQQKITTGTAGEQAATDFLGLHWTTATKGVDATLKGKGYEIKAASLPAQKDIKKKQININYALPKRGKGESLDVYCERVKAWARKADGGHYWTLWASRSVPWFKKAVCAHLNTPDAGNELQSVLKVWWVPAETLGSEMVRMVRALWKKDPTRRDFKINFGSKICPACYSVHRMDKLADALGGRRSFAFVDPLPVQPEFVKIRPPVEYIYNCD